VGKVEKPKNKRERKDKSRQCETRRSGAPSLASLPGFAIDCSNEHRRRTWA